jgi:hypothetical protein
VFSRHYYCIQLSTLEACERFENFLAERKLHKYQSQHFHDVINYMQIIIWVVYKFDSISSHQNKTGPDAKKEIIRMKNGQFVCVNVTIAFLPNIF